jgi:general secretion pathway protein D
MLSLLLLSACAEQQIRRDAQAAVLAGDHDTALQQLQTGVNQFPESTVLRSSLLQVRDAALNKRLAMATALIADGLWTEAEVELQRAKLIGPTDPRIVAMLAEIGTLRRQQQALVDAEQFLANKKPEAALKTLAQALKDNPRHAGLLALQRRVEVDLRARQAQSDQARLSESRPISLDFRDGNLRTVLDVVSRNSGINFILDRDIRPDTRVTVFLRQARVEDALDLIIGTNQLAKKVVDAHTIVVYPNTPDKQREYQEQIVRVFYLASAEAKGAAAFLRAMLKIRDPFVDERSNMLALRESAENVQLAERLIALYDAGEPEVLLEVEVLEVSATRLTELGVKFPDSFSLTPLAPEGASGLTLGNLRDIGRGRIGVGVSGLLINLKREVGDFSTLANPKIRARNKEKAKIMVGDKVPVITTTTGTGGFVSDSVNYLDVGLKLDIEPTVYADDEVAIKVALEVSSLGSAVRTNSGTLAYQIGTRNASTLLRLRDGETQLLAGLISREDRTSASRVPGMGDLPVLGRLFSSQLDNGQRTELLLAITPRILRNIRRPDANETELWVGTDALPRLRLPLPATAGGPSGVAGQEPVAPLSGPVTLQGPSPAGAALGAPVAGEPPRSAAPAAPPAANLQLTWLGPAEAKVGETIALALKLNGTQGLRGMPVDISFDAKHLQLLDAVEGDYFRRDGASTSFSKSVDAGAGRLRAGVLRNQATSAAGQGTVLSLQFKALAAGVATVRVEGATPVALDGPASPVSPTAPWTLTIR